MPLAFSFVYYAVYPLWTLLSKVARLPHTHTLNDSGYSAHNLSTTISPLHDRASHEDISDRLFNPLSFLTSLLVTTTDAEDQMPRQTTEQALPQSNLSSTISAYGTTPIGGVGGKRRSRQSKRSESGDLAPSANESFLFDDTSSLQSWTTSSTVCTVSELDNDLDPIQGVLQLVPDGDVIEAATMPPPTFTCRFWFLRCDYASTNEMEWKEHNLAHFRGQSPPLSNTCPLCDMTFNIPDPNVSWAANMSHLAQHFKLGDTMASALPEYALVRHLWSKRIICDADYQELMGYRRKHGKYQYKILEGRDRRERRGYYGPQSRI
ncbi:uncharacterized protein PV09_07436 [Verruconis gallopava]|uniref:Uncharacterized protein n=1 Tax=Verruconis gallopava TaxID=253628 RepID=A0A0D2A3X1_9PEZI|nr:uncharacterized protein PV09_07436 [Verruconis gallopava]KIW01150.1 hypothetical protein PV09_07436 [Verruconis gallopava]